MSAGGYSAPQDATPEVQGYCNAVKLEVQKQTGSNYSVFQAERYISQVVSGMNYVVKVRCGGTEYIHIKIYVPLTMGNQPPKLEGYQQCKTKEDPIMPF
ncbi:cystatin-A5-like [Pleurodeles waltl]|uniref:cystatin-A5-like n=1 Tax=Pleurodeles waltl TaxID=8319 RepID=UPI0037097446